MLAGFTYEDVRKELRKHPELAKVKVTFPAYDGEGHYAAWVHEIVDIVFGPARNDSYAGVRPGQAISIGRHLWDGEASRPLKRKTV